jgi:hypothetical protein
MLYSECNCHFHLILIPHAYYDSALLPHRALRAQIEDLAARLDHPDLAVQARYYESIQLNKQLRAAVCVLAFYQPSPYSSVLRPLGERSQEDTCG